MQSGLGSKFWQIYAATRKEKNMARHGENIRKRADGRWEGRYKTWDEHRGREFYRSVYGRTYEEVKEKMSRARFEHTQTAAGENQAQGGQDAEGAAAVWTWQFCTHRLRGNGL